MEQAQPKEQPPPGLWLGAGIEVRVCEPIVLSQQVALQPFRGFQGHLHPVLEDGHWEVWTRHGGEPEPEVLVHLHGQLLAFGS